MQRLGNKIPEPEWVVYEVTDACNSRCKHCHIWQRKPTSDILTVPEIEKLFKDNFSRHIKTVLLTGGEPVIRNDIKDLITTIHNALPKTNITLSTNALLADRVLDVLRYTIANNICLYLGISLDAVGEKHDLIRGVKGNFEKADYLIREALKLREQFKDKIGGIVVGHTMSKLTVDTLKEVITYAERLLKIGWVTQLYEEFPYYSNVDNKEKNIENYRQSDNQLLINEIKELAPSLHHEILLRALKHKLRYKCSAMRTFFLLKCNGDITPCLQFSDVIVGNIKNNSPAEIWHSHAAEEARKLVNKCPGCSNTWATSWSYLNWPLPFWRLLITLQIRKLLRKLKHTR